MHRNGHSCTPVLNIECKIKFLIPDFVQNLNFCQFGHIVDYFGQYYCTYTETVSRKTTSSVKFDPYSNSPCLVSYMTINFGN